MIRKIWKRIKSRTYWLAASIAAIGPQLIDQMPLLQEWLADNYKLALFVLGVAIAFCREITKTSLEEK